MRNHQLKSIPSSKICVLILLLKLSYAAGGKPCSGSISAGSLVKNSQTDMPRTSRLLNTGETWICDQEYTWRELGEKYYPRYVREVTCLNTTCMFGYYTCNPVYMNVKVLKFNTVGCLDLNIPYELRSSWLFQDIAVAVHCFCGRVQ